MSGVGVRQPRGGDAHPQGHVGDSAHHLIQPAIICPVHPPVLPLRKADPANNAGLLRLTRAKCLEYLKNHQPHGCRIGPNALPTRNINGFEYPTHMEVAVMYLRWMRGGFEAPLRPRPGGQKMMKSSSSCRSLMYYRPNSRWHTTRQLAHAHIVQLGYTGVTEASGARIIVPAGCFFRSAAGSAAHNIRNMGDRCLFTPQARPGYRLPTRLHTALSSTKSRLEKEAERGQKKTGPPPRAASIPGTGHTPTCPCAACAFGMCGWPSAGLSF